ncbi:unnamed protein product [Polarella glacialis]|uniref:Endonuclease/exonuclease/phosphatase domain-containing protein n=1 Tax=Polarella glacialis TaxID=89957 RepID=A0A813HJB0_POLGL|nr:unnamed protein product [Polarella glacialis]
MTLNLQHLASFPRDPAIARKRLEQITTACPQPDLVCVQEGLEGFDLLGQVGYTKLISSAVKAQPLRDMVYGDPGALAAVPELVHDKLVVNELYMRSSGSAWEVDGTGVEQISSEGLVLSLEGYETQERQLATRSVVWARLRPRGSTEGPFAFVLNTQLCGGYYEDQFLERQLVEELRLQQERALDVFLAIAGEADLGILVGDFGPRQRQLEARPENCEQLELTPRFPKAPGPQSSPGRRPSPRSKRFAAAAALNAQNRCSFTQRSKVGDMKLLGPPQPNGHGNADFDAARRILP